MRILECHSQGDKRFSAFYAKVEVNGKLDSIENHYQLSKRIYGKRNPVSWREMKGITPSYFIIGSKMLPNELLSQFYKLLWIKYFDKNPDLLEYVSTFDDFKDKFKGKSLNCQSDVIRKIVKEGRGKVMDECRELVDLLKSKDDLLVIDKSLFESNQDIIGHQVNCQGVMNSGIAKEMKKLPNVYEEYKNKCINKEDILGDLQVVEYKEGKFVANIFGQYYYGTDKRYTDYDALKKSLNSLKEYAIKKGLSVALPYNIGCGLAGGDWKVVSTIIKETFNDYPIVLYRLK